MTRVQDVRDLRRIALLARRAASDWGSSHPEIRAVASLLDRQLVQETSEEELDVRALLRELEKAKSVRDDGPMYDVVRRDLRMEIAELDEVAPVQR